MTTPAVFHIILLGRLDRVLVPLVSVSVSSAEPSLARFSLDRWLSDDMSMPSFIGRLLPKLTIQLHQYMSWHDERGHKTHAIPSYV